MHLLIITHIFWPEGADFKNIVLAREFVKKGHKVTVLAPFPNYPLGRIYDGYKQSWRQWEYKDGIRILRVPLFPKHNSSARDRILNYMSFTFSAAIIGIALIRRVDAVFVYSPPMTLGLVALLFKIFYRIPVLLDVVDLWPEAISGSGMVDNKILAGITEIIAKSAYYTADKITVLSDGFMENLQNKGINSNKVEVVYPWADSSIFYTTKPDSEFGKKYNIEDKFNIMYTGNIGPFQDFENILNAAFLLKNVKKICFVLVGDGQERANIEEFIEREKLDNVILAGRYPIESMPGIMAWAGALLITLKDDPYLEINIPSKICAYMATQRPILVCANGETRDIVQDARIGLTCPPGNPHRLAETARIFLSLTPEELKAMGTRCKTIFENKFNIKTGIRKYSSLLDSMVDN